jgi:hypothetical protein
MKCKDCIHFQQALERIFWVNNHIAFKCPATGKYSMDKWGATNSCLEFRLVQASGGPEGIKSDPAALLVPSPKLSAIDQALSQSTSTNGQEVPRLMTRKTNRKSATKQATEEVEVNTITGIVCTANRDLARDKAHALVLHYYRKGVRDVSQIGFMILMSPEKPLRLPSDPLTKSRQHHHVESIYPGTNKIPRP